MPWTGRVHVGRITARLRRDDSRANSDPNLPPPPDVPFVDRATWWLSTGPGAWPSVATLAALAAFALVAPSRRLQRSAPLCCSVWRSWQAPSPSPGNTSCSVGTRPQPQATGPHGSSTSRRLVHEEPLPTEPPGRGAAQPWLEVANETRSTHDPDAMFRRPPARHVP